MSKVNSETQTINSVIINSPIMDVWWYFSTPKGWCGYLSDIATIEGGKEELEMGNKMQIVIGDLTNYATCTYLSKPNQVTLKDRFEGLMADGSILSYSLTTNFQLEEIDKENTKITVTVEGYDNEDDFMQWLKDCGEMGWRQSLFNLKCILELGLDLRNEIFGYPRLGVMNLTANERHYHHSLPEEKKIRGNYIETVFPNSPADFAGLKRGDIITNMDGKEVPDYASFVKALSYYYRKNGVVDISYLRENSIHQTNATLTYDEHFTGMIDPNVTPLDEVSNTRKQRNIKSLK
ncbi:PDZ domain-containing protein [Cytobacillus pseudoceanisediminis]|uniref:PDZ domain-containing protein n=1 Tax=Cytobacillus pseudoceanisediminis TaxID=3051614 RepID=UPI003C2C9457